MHDSFWEHLNGLSVAYQTLEKECTELRVVNAQLQRGEERPSSTSRAEKTSHRSVTLLDAIPKLPLEEDLATTIAVEIPAEAVAINWSGPEAWLPKPSRAPETVKVALDKGDDSDPCEKQVSLHSGELYEFSELPSMQDVRTTRIAGSISSVSLLDLDERQSLGQIASPSLGHVIFDVVRRWEDLVQLMITFMGRSDNYILRPCWRNKKSQGKGALRKLITELGTEAQDIDGIVQEWSAGRWGGGRRKSFIASKASRGSLHSTDSTDAGWDAAESSGENVLRCIMHPLSPFRAIWSFVGLTLVAYDAVVLSLSVFEAEASSTTLIIDWFLRFFWVMDIMISFRTGFYVKCKYVDSPKAIARQYATTWFTFDLVALLPDILIAIFSANVSGASSGLFKTLRWIKLFKVLRLVRIAKFAVLLRTFMESLNNINVNLLLEILKSCFLMLCWIHIVGCAWYAVGKLGNNKDNSWIIKAGVENFKLPHTYFISVQWALSLLQANTDIYPSFSVEEGAFAIIAIMASIFIMAVFISNLTNMLIQIQNAWGERARQMRALQDYLYVHQVSSDVSESVRKYAEEKMKIDKRLQLDEDEVTACLPKSLRRALLVEVRGKMINVKSPVFQAIQRMLPKCFEKICCDLLIPHFAGPDTQVYEYGALCNRTYFNVAGDIHYDAISNRALRACLNMIGDAKYEADPLSDAATFNAAWMANPVLERSTTPVLQRPTSHVLQRSKTPMLDRSKTTASTPLVCIEKSLGVGTTFPESNDCPEMTKISSMTLHKSFMRERLRAKQNLFSSTELRHSQPICEQALWTFWHHEGDLHASSHAAFLTLDSDSFSLLTEHYNGLRAVCAPQAIRFCRVLNSSECRISDLMTSTDVLHIIQSCGEFAVKRSTRRSIRSSKRWSMRMSLRRPHDDRG